MEDFQESDFKSCGRVKWKLGGLSNLCLSFCNMVFWFCFFFFFFKSSFGGSKQLADFPMNVLNAEDLYFGHVPNMHYS